MIIINILIIWVVSVFWLSRLYLERMAHEKAIQDLNAKLELSKNEAKESRSELTKTQSQLLYELGFRKKDMSTAEAWFIDRLSGIPTQRTVGVSEVCKHLYADDVYLKVYPSELAAIAARDEIGKRRVTKRENNEERHKTNCNYC